MILASSFSLSPLPIHHRREACGGGGGGGGGFLLVPSPPPPLFPLAGEAMPPPPPWLLLVAMPVVVGVLEPMNGDAAAECNGKGEGGTEERLPVLGFGLEEGDGMKEEGNYQ